MNMETNIGAFASGMSGRLKALVGAGGSSGPVMDKILREATSTMLAETKRRIFQEGNSSTGAQIGTYSDPYMKTRAKYNWGGSRKVILVLTDQMRSDYNFGPVDRLSYGLGFHNRINYEKMRHNEERYKVSIASLTQTEATLCIEIITNRINSQIHGNP